MLPGLLNQDEDGCDYSDVIENASGSYSTSMIIPSALCGVVIGAKGATKKRIEQETKTHISVPPQGKHGKTGL